MNANERALLVGISGISSSGKTTLARLLRDILPNAFVLHEDDFFKTGAEIPVVDGVQDWDCLEAINVPQLHAALTHIKQTGQFPPRLISKEDQNSVGEVSIHSSIIEALKNSAAENLPSSTPIAIIDGFLLYSQAMSSVRSIFDVKLLLHTDYDTVKARREARSGYVTLEGFWEDPPGYVDGVVWPNYAKDHAFLFQAGDVESGEFDGTLCEELGIEVCPREWSGDMGKCLEWAFEVVARKLVASEDTR